MHPRLAAARARVSAGFTLLEVALVLSLTGVLLAAFLPTFLREVHTSKLSEATEQLASLHRHAAAYYAARGQCLPQSAGPYPITPSADPVPVDFAADPAGASTWLALGQRGTPLLRFSYEIAVTDPGCHARPLGVAAIYFRAHGDLDADGEHSLLERAAAPSEGGLTPVGPLRILGRTE